MFLNCLSLDLTVIDLISICIVHTEKILGRNFKEFRDADVQGKGSLVSSDTPRRGEGGSRKGKFMRMSFMNGWPLGQIHMQVENLGPLSS